MRPPFVCFSSSSANPLSEFIYSTPDKQINVSFFPPSPYSFFEDRNLFRSFCVSLSREGEYSSSKVNLEKSIDSIHFFHRREWIERKRRRGERRRENSRRSRTRSIHDGASLRARSVQQAASPVSGRSGANRRIGGKMAKVSRESRGGAAARPAHRRILVLLAPIPPKIPERSRTPTFAFQNTSSLFFARRANSLPPTPGEEGGNRNFCARGERIN